MYYGIGLNNRVAADRAQGFNPIKNKNKIFAYQEQALNMMILLDLSDPSIYQSYYPLLDDKALIKLFREHTEHD